MWWWCRKVLVTIIFLWGTVSVWGSRTFRSTGQVPDCILACMCLCYFSYFLACCHISSLTQSLCWTHALYPAYNEQDLSPKTGEKRCFSTDSHRNQTTRIYLWQRSNIQCTCIETTTCVSPTLPSIHACACTDTQRTCLWLCTDFLQPGLLLTKGWSERAILSSCLSSCPWRCAESVSSSISFPYSCMLQ